MKKLLAVVLLLCSLFAVAGCSGETGGTAAIVNGTRISDAEVTKVADALEPIDPERHTSFQLRHDAVTGLIQDKLADRLEAVTGKHASDADVDRLLRKVPSVQNSPVARSWLRGTARLQVLSQQVDEKTFYDAVRGANVQLNPRYGTWNLDNLYADARNRSMSEEYTGK